jgi:hypothetical protein
MGSKPLPTRDPTESNARREFLLRCGRFAAITPPAMTMLLAVATTPTEAHASTYGWGNQNNQGQNNNNQGKNNNKQGQNGNG